LRTLATQASELKNRIQSLLENRTRQVQVSTEVAQKIAMAPALDVLFRQVVNMIKTRFDYYHVHIYSMDKDSLVLQEGTGEAGRQMKEAGHHISLMAEKSLVARAARSGEPILIPDVEREPSWLPNPFLPYTRSELAVPIKLGTAVLGILDVQGDRIGGLTVEDQILLTGLCGQIAVTINSHRVEAERRQANERMAMFRALAENAVDAISMASQNLEIVYANGAFHRLYGYNDKLREVEGMQLAQFLLPEDQSYFAEEILPQLLSRGWSGELRGRRKDGTTFYASLTQFPVYDSARQLAAIGGIVRDITESKVAEAERHRLQEQIIEAQQVALRELSTPIIPIMDRIIVIPLIGAIDTNRARDITRSLLAGISQHRAKVVILDITGVDMVDSEVAGYLDKTVQAARLKGAHTIITGISDAVAETIVDLGIDWSGIETLNDLKTGLIVALNILRGRPNQ
jgi:anti-anti-sigma factor